MVTWTLQPHEAFRPDPSCSHCTGNPGYTHRHWLQEERPAPAWEPNRIWRALFKIYGDGSSR